MGEEKKEVKKTTLFTAVLPLIFMFVVLFTGLVVYSIDIKILLIICAAFTICVCMYQGHKWKEIEDEIVAKLAKAFPAIMILTFAWTLSGITGLLGADVFVAGILANSTGVLQVFIPIIVFCIAVFLAFATGTSWGTFGILLPIVVPIMQTGSEMLTITVAATLAGAVCGDHCSPISDTTIMASTGAQCDHINHVSTQLPYALTVAAVSAVNYVLAALIQNWMINLPIAIVSMVVVILAIRKLYGDKEVPAEK